MPDNPLDPPALRLFLDSQLEAYLSDLALLVGLDSYSYDRDDVNRVNDWLAAELQRLGFTVQRHPNTNAGDDLVATRQGRGTARIVLLGHTDTVFPRGTAAARPMCVQGDKILGPGTCDMKGGLLTGLYALKALHAAGFDDYAQISFLAVSDEEIDQRHSVQLIQTTSRDADAVLTLEAARANGDIVTARKGARWFTITAHGHAAHAGVEPEKGRNAIAALCRRLIDLESLNDPARQITVNVGVIAGGRLPNVVPDYAQAKLDVRAFTRTDLDQVTQAILDICAKPSVPPVHFTVAYDEVSPPMPRTARVAALEALAQQAATELGFLVNGASTGGAADGAFAADAGVPVLDGLGPVGGLDHGPDEYILRSSIVPRTALLARLINLIARSAARA
ncbi:MAG: M20 family metallopeptidase [Anaerolineae bacterium]|nr:M20 family metallopeptidase [Anaerolineae bacterium]